MLRRRREPQGGAHERGDLQTRPAVVLVRQLEGQAGGYHSLRRGGLRAFDCDAEVVALALDRVHLAVEFADPHDAVPEPDVAVVEDEVAVWGPVVDVSDHRVVSLGRTLERQLAGKRGDLFHVVEVAEGERQRQLSGEIARRGVVVQPSGELRIAEGDPNWRALRGVGVLVAGGRARTWRRSRSARSGSAGGLVAVLVSPTASRE